MRNDANSTKQGKHSMLMDLKLKASQGAYTMAMSTKPQRAKMTQNSPKADQNKARTRMGWGQNML